MSVMKEDLLASEIQFSERAADVAGKRTTVVGTLRHIS
jgi:hypothetical protein